MTGLRVVVSGWLLLLPTTLVAQQRSADQPKVSNPESIRVIAAAAIPLLANQLLDGTQAATRLPWRIDVPDTSASWLKLRDGLYVLLHAREPVPTDRRIRILRFGPLAITGDSLFGTVLLAGETICKNRRLMSSTEVRFRAIRSGPSWAPAQEMYRDYGDMGDTGEPCE